MDAAIKKIYMCVLVYGAALIQNGDEIILIEHSDSSPDMFGFHVINKFIVDHECGKIFEKDLYVSCDDAIH